MKLPPGLEPADDLSPAGWVTSALKDWPMGRRFVVGDLVPPVFEAYARILHHPWRPADVRDPTGRWADRAVQRGSALGPETRWDSLRFGANDPWSLPPDGSISESELSSIVRVIDESAQDGSACWFGLWSGFGFLNPASSSSYLLAGRSSRLVVARARMERWITNRRARLRKPRVRTFQLLDGGRSYILFRGVLEDAVRIHRECHLQPPTLWWPDDRSWFVHTEIDAVSTYVGGNKALIDRLLGDESLETFEVGPETVAAL